MSMLRLISFNDAAVSALGGRVHSDVRQHVVRC